MMYSNKSHLLNLIYMEHCKKTCSSDYELLVFDIQFCIYNHVIVLCVCVCVCIMLERVGACVFYIYL